jgi:hypothetical protein
MKRTGLMVAVLVISAGWVVSDCRAWDPGMPWFGYGYSGSLYGLGYLPVPPYFAVHPPVQYSHPVGYPYGRSPYARRSHESQIVVQVPRPQVIVNPFVTVAAPSSDAPPAVSPIITNPYYQPKP